MPYILQFSAVYDNLKHFNHLVWPTNEKFEIHPKASEVNGFKRPEFDEKVGINKLSMLEVWKLFITWIEGLGFNLKKDIYLCAYNGYHFDFRVVIHELRR